MTESPAKRSRPTASGSVRWGRPPRELAGEVEERILEAATKVLLSRGFEGATIDEIAEQARAGKPTIYARFSNKEALFCAVVARSLQRNLRWEAVAPIGSTVEERLKALATILLERALASENIELMRLTAAEARRFPDLANSVYKMVREQGNKAVAQLLGELARDGAMAALPSFAQDRMQATSHRFSELIIIPIAMRALFAEDLSVLRAEIAAHVEASIAFFLAGVRSVDAC